MSIRLNKAIRELNIGLQTAVEFLEKKKELGEVKGDPNFKLSDEQYSALVEQFKNDKDVKSDAAKIFQKKTKDKKQKEKAESTKAQTESEMRRQQFKPLGKIDLSTFEKKPAETPSQETADKQQDTTSNTPLETTASVKAQPSAPENIPAKKIKERTHDLSYKCKWNILFT